MRRGYNVAMASNPYIVAFFACIGGGLCGLGITSMTSILTNPAWLAQFGNPGKTLQGGITSCIPGGSFVGSLAVTAFADRIGRKNTIILASAIWVVGAILQCASVNIAMLVVGRFIAGFAAGLSSAVVPVYQAEVTAPAIRGRMVSLQQWSITWGIFIQYFIQFGCSYMDGSGSFRIPWGLQAIPAIVVGVGMTFLPESPRWLIDHNRADEALQLLADLHGGGDINHELVLLEFEEIKEQVYFEKTQGAKSFADLAAPGMFRRVFLGCSMQMWCQLSGINTMMYYIVYVFQGAGLTGRRGSLIASAVNYVLNVALTIPALVYIDSWGRRPMVIGGATCMSFFLILVGGLQAGFGQWQGPPGGADSAWVILNNSGATYAIIVCSYLAVGSFAISLGPVCWTYPAEIFPMRVRSKAVSLATATNWLFNFALAWAVPPWLQHIAYGTYFIFAGFNIAAAIHFFFMFPEITGRTLEEVEAIFNAGHMFAAWKTSDRSIGRKPIGDVGGAHADMDEKA